MKKYIFFTFICICLYIFSADNVFACICATREFEDEYKSATMIFSGKVISVETEKSRRKVKIKIENSWKGNLPEIVTISGPSNDVPCGYKLAVGEKYLIYSDDEKASDLHINFCSRTTILSMAKKDIKLLKSLRAKNAQN